MMHGLFLLMRTEFKILARDRSAMMMSLVMPLLMGAFFGFSFSSFDADDGTGSLVGVWPAIAVQVVIMLGFAIYIRSTVMMTSHRQSLFLKRLRSSEIGDSGLCGTTRTSKASASAAILRAPVRPPHRQTETRA